MPAILIVEDDPSTLEAVSAMLEVSGHSDVQCAKDGVACLEMLREYGLAFQQIRASGRTSLETYTNGM